ncbi:hypothetical protein [Conyzicola sp.]|uniref:hypothetical protein n=1 Tax=Conyzicola sp. TaxID=1969404 RepID=UPI003989DA11
MLRMTRLLPSLAAVALLAACAGPQSIAHETGVDLPEALQSDPQAVFDAGMGAAWDDDRGSLVVVVYGSSSCAPVPTDLTVADPRTLALTFAQSPNNPCTADLAPTTYRFGTPSGVGDGDVVLTVTFDGDGETSESTVPILE